MKLKFIKKRKNLKIIEIKNVMVFHVINFGTKDNKNGNHLSESIKCAEKRKKQGDLTVKIVISELVSFANK